MNSARLIVVIILVSFAYQLIFAQGNSPTSNGPVPKSKSEQINVRTPSAGSVTFGSAYGYSSLQSSTLLMPLPGGGPFTLLKYWVPPVFASSMTQMRFLPRHYYITDVGPPPKLFEMDPDDGVVTFVGIINGMGAGEPLNGISYNPDNNTFYLISDINFYSFNPASLTATLIGPFNAGGAMIDLCFDEYGNCYAYDIETDTAYSVDITTGNASPLGPLGFDANYGQGMGYDFGTLTIYLSAFNNTTFTGQLRIMDPVTGMTTLVTDWGFEQIAPFAPPTMLCMSPVGEASDPDPPYGAFGIPVEGVTLSWVNGVYTINVEVWFGIQGNVAKVYDGPAITSWDSGTLLYSTEYNWYIVCKDTICGGRKSPTWIFNTENEAGVIFIEQFNDISDWTWLGPLGQANWSNPESNFAGGTAPELMCSYLPSYDGLNQLISPLITTDAAHYHQLKSRYMYDWFADPAPIHGLAVTYDGGITKNSLWQQAPVGGNTGPAEIEIQYFPAADTFQIIIYNDGNSFNMDYIYYDDIFVTDLELIPAELFSFMAKADNDVITLSWQTATETNNRGFEIQRKTEEKDFNAIGFIIGFGTTAEQHNYSYTDKNLDNGRYYYRLKQIDFNGNYEYSDIAEVDVMASDSFLLEQNYPNPFNSATMIDYILPKGSTVSLKIFNVLGKEIRLLVNNEFQKAGKHSALFNINSALPSGVYFYQIKAGDFIQTKRMILLK